MRAAQVCADPDCGVVRKHVDDTAVTANKTAHVVCLWHNDVDSHFKNTAERNVFCSSCNAADVAHFVYGV